MGLMSGIKETFKNSRNGGKPGDLSKYVTAEEKKSRKKFLRDTKPTNKLKLKAKK